MPRPIRVTATDPDTGETGTVDLAPGKFVVTCAEPAYVAGEQTYRNGTTVITIKKRKAGE